MAEVLHDAPNTPFGSGGTPGSAGMTLDVPISWIDLTYDVPGLTILKGLTGVARPRRALAVMGSSGAGKTTFLNAISDRLQHDGREFRIGGVRMLGDIEYEHQFRSVLGFVTQDDILAPMSTPTEAMHFSLHVRRGLDSEACRERVAAELAELGLEDAKDTIVGIPGIMAGLSGGERKRTSIGVELITDPKVLLADEPTSGLDSVTAAKIVKLCQQLSRRGRTVIYTIHQPTAECIQHFDDLMLMALGCCVYHGPMSESVDYFSSIGYDCPDTFTPTDFFMTLLQDPEIAPLLVDKWNDYVEAVKKKGEQANPYVLIPPVKNKSMTRTYLEYWVESKGSGWSVQFGELLYRSWTNVTRNKMFIGSIYVQNIFFALIAGIIFANLTDDIQGVADRNGLIFMVVINQAFSSIMSVLNTFKEEKPVFIRDQQAAAYSPLLYFLAKSIAEFPFQASALFIQAVILYWIAGLVPEAKNFFLFYAILVCMQQVGVGIGLAISCAFDSYIVASGMTPIIVIPMMLVAGLFAATSRLRPYWYWLEKISFLRMGFVLAIKNEFNDLPNIECDSQKFGMAFCSRQPTTGREVLHNMEFDDKHAQEWIQWMSLGILFVLGRILCIGFLYKIALAKQ